MGIKEWAGCGVVLTGGAVYGISQYGLNDALSEDLRHISEVAYEERSAYMEAIVSEFAEAFATYSVETETYIYEGWSNFSAMPEIGAFIEVVRQENPVPSEELSGLNAEMVNARFCEQDEMTMFTDNGWAYRFSMTDSNERRIFAVICEPNEHRINAIS